MDLERENNKMNSNEIRYFIYRNLHKDCWSVKNVETGLVQGLPGGNHVHFVTIFNPKFKVSKAGRNRVLREKRKNVHAGVQGTIDFTVGGSQEDSMSTITYENFKDSRLRWADKIKPVYYNPYKYETFMCDGKPILEADIAFMLHDGDKFIVEAGMLS
jgi:hypothetical protein